MENLTLALENAPEALKLAIFQLIADATDDLQQEDEDNADVLGDLMIQLDCQIGVVIGLDILKVLFAPPSKPQPDSIARIERIFESPIIFGKLKNDH